MSRDPAGQIQSATQGTMGGKPVRDPPLAYLLATLAGFATYGLLHVVIGIAYPVALFLGFVGAHGGLLLGRHFLK